MIQNGLKRILKQKKPKTNFFPKNFWTEKNRHFWPKFDVFGQKWPFLDPKGHFLVGKFFFKNFKFKNKAKKLKNNFFSTFLIQKNRDFWPKLEVFGQKWPFSDPKDQFFGRPKKKFSHIIFWSHPERHFKLSYAPIPQCMWSG